MFCSNIFVTLFPPKTVFGWLFLASCLLILWFCLLLPLVLRISLVFIKLIIVGKIIDKNIIDNQFSLNTQPSLILLICRGNCWLFISIPGSENKFWLLSIVVNLIYLGNLEQLSLSPSILEILSHHYLQKSGTVAKQLNSWLSGIFLTHEN